MSTTLNLDHVMGSFWIFGMAIPFIVSLGIFLRYTRNLDSDNRRQSLSLLAFILTIKPVFIGFIGFFMIMTMPSYLAMMPIVGLITSIAVSIFFSPLLFGYHRRTEAWILVALDWARLLFSGWLTYTPGTYAPPEYFLYIAFFNPTIFAIVALTLARVKVPKRKSKRVLVS